MKRLALLIIMAGPVLIQPSSSSVELLPAVTVEAEPSQNFFGRYLCIDVYNGWCPELNRPTPIQYNRTGG